MKQLHTFTTICIAIECLLIVNDSVFAQGKNVVSTTKMPLEKETISKKTTPTVGASDTIKKNKNPLLTDPLFNNHLIIMAVFKKHSPEKKLARNRRALRKNLNLDSYYKMGEN